jgi:PKD repeat protein
LDAYEITGLISGNSYQLDLEVSSTLDLDMFIYDTTGGRDDAIASSTNIGPGTDESIMFTAPSLGDYLLVITNENGESGEYTIKPGSSPPVADAGEDQTVLEGNSIIFDGSYSYDPQGGDLSYMWDFDVKRDSDGDGIPENDVDSTETKPMHIYGDNGIFRASLKVVNGYNLSAIDNCNITVLNVDPILDMVPPSMDIEISLRMAGSKWSNAEMTLYENDQSIGFLEVERWPGNPDDNPHSGDPTIPLSLNLTRRYSAIVTYNPYPDSGDAIRGDQPNNGKDKQNNAGNPVWVVVRFPNGSEERAHHTFNTQQSKKRGSTHPNHVDPWEVDIMELLIGHSSEVLSHITDPGSDDIELEFTYGTEALSKVYLNAPPDPDPYPSPEVNPMDIMDTMTLVYKGEGTLILAVSDDDGGEISVKWDLK